MIVHIVMGSAKEGMKDRLPEVKAALEALPDKIEQIRTYEVGIDEMGSERSADFVLYSRFDSFDDLATYNKHPEHVKALQLIGSILTDIRVVDHTID